MIVKSLTASFGKLKNETISFHEGLNVIYAPNESGKSTWCAFMTAMLYGIDSSERAKAGYLPDKTKYAPWSGAPMSGTMVLEADGCDITLTRTTLNSAAPMRELKAVYTGTDIPVKGLGGADTGEMLTGVSREVFRRSAFIPQGAVAATGGAELEKRIAAIVSGGEEDTGFAEAEKTLKNALNRRRYNRSGVLPQLETELDSANERLHRLEGGEEELRRQEEKLALQEKRCDELEKDMAECRRAQRKASLEALSRVGEETERCRFALDRTIGAVAERESALLGGPFDGKTADEAEASAEKDVERCKRLEALCSEKHTVSVISAVLCFALAAAMATVYLAKEIPLGVLFVAGILSFTVLGLVFLAYYMSARKKIRESENELLEILSHYKADGPGDIALALARYTEAFRNYESALREQEKARSAWEEACRARSELEPRIVAELDFSETGTGEASRLARSYREERRKLQELSESVSGLKAVLSESEDRSVLESGIADLTERYEKASGEYDAIALALKVLQDADRDIKTQFSPELGRLAAEYMSLMTGGRYGEIDLSETLEPSARAGEDAVPHQAAYLSAGTTDLMYLAVRLAVCEMALPDGKNCPIIIDDALVNLDTERYGMAMRLLKRLAENRQIILFTCRE